MGDRPRVTYSHAMREQAVAEDKPLVTVDIDRRHCTSRPDGDRTRITMQGPASPKASNLVRRTLLQMCHVPDDKINELITELAGEDHG